MTPAPDSARRAGLACITDRAAIEAAFAADCEAEAQRELQPSPIRFVPTTPDDGDEGSTHD